MPILLKIVAVRILLLVAIVIVYHHQLLEKVVLDQKEYRAAVVVIGDPRRVEQINNADGLNLIRFES